VSFQDGAWFGEASFHQRAWFSGASIQGDAVFSRTKITQPFEPGPLAVAGTLCLDRIVFAEPVHLEVAAWRLLMQRTRFRAGGHLRVGWAEITLEGAETGAPLILAASGPPAELIQRVAWLQDPGGRDPRQAFPPPRVSLLSMQHADVGALTVVDVELANCHVAGAQHLDRLQVSAADAFHRAPALLRGWGRQVLVEEAAWRARHHRWRRRRRWQRRLSAQTNSPLLGGVRQPGPAELAGLYRQLRKGREEAKNEPGAANFYYGECEMRRHARSTPGVERAILWVYWLVSGYGLRAWRALAALAVLIGLVGAGFSLVGFHHPHPSLAVAWLYALQATVSLEGRARQFSGQLTLPGELLRVGLRLTGPVLLGLALLSIRGRVKR
jgi:hypothetical protein